MAVKDAIARPLSLIGSLFAQRAPDGKVDVAVGPLAVVACGGLFVACSFQNDEPFSQCVITIGKYIFGG